MDPYDPAPQLQQIATTHTIAATPPDSTAPGELPQLEGGQGNERFSSVDEVIARVRQLHEVVDEDVAPHKSKYAARMIMTDILTILKPLLQKHSDSPATVQWVTEQIGRLEYLNGVNHIEAEETSAGEKMLQKAMLKFKDAAERYPFDVIDGYNHLAIVWSNRTQHAVAHAYLQVAQHVFLRFKKLRAAALALLSPEEKKLVSERDHAEQQAEAIDEVQQMDQQQQQHKIVEYTEEDERRDALLQPLAITSIPPSTPGYSFVQPSYWHRLEVNHTLTLFFLAQVFGHMKKRDLAAIYAHLCLNRQLKQKKDFQRTEWVTNAIGLSFYYSGRKMFQQAHHCLLAAQSFVKDDDMPKKMNTPTADTSRDQQLAADLCRAWGAFYLKWLQRSRDLLIETEALPSVAASMANAAASDPTLADISKASGTSAFTSPASAGAGKPDEHGEADPTSSLSSLPPAELAELKRLQRLDRERERHFENQIEEEADEEEDDLFGDLSKARVMKSPEKIAAEEKAKLAADATGASSSSSEKSKIDKTLPSSLTKAEQEAVTEELKKSTEEEAEDELRSAEETAAAVLAMKSIEDAEKALDRSNAQEAASASGVTIASSASSSSSSSPSSGPLFIEFKSLHLRPSPRCVPATTFTAARALFKLSLEWFTKAGMFYILDGYVSDHIPIQQDISLLYKLLAVFDMDLSRQCKMHKRRIDLLTPIQKQLSIAAYQEFYQQLTDEIATAYSEMMELKQFILQMKVRLLGKKLSEKKREDAQQKINELALHAIQFYQLWLQSWSKDGKPVVTLDEYYHRWYLMAMFKVARCYSKVFHTDPQVANTFTKKALDQYRAVVQKALDWNAVHVMPQELELCKEMIELLPFKMDRVSGTGKGFRV